MSFFTYTPGHVPLLVGQCNESSHLLSCLSYMHGWQHFLILWQSNFHLILDLCQQQNTCIQIRCSGSKNKDCWCHWWTSTLNRSNSLLWRNSEIWTEYVQVNLWHTPELLECCLNVEVDAEQYITFLPYMAIWGWPFVKGGCLPYMAISQVRVDYSSIPLVLMHKFRTFFYVHFDKWDPRLGINLGQPFTKTLYFFLRQTSAVWRQTAFTFEFISLINDKSWILYLLLDFAFEFIWPQQSN